MRGSYDGPSSRPLSYFRNRGRLLRDRLEQRGDHALPVADEERPSDRANSAAPDARRKTRRAHVGGGRGGRRCKALFRRQGDGFFPCSASTSASRTHSLSASTPRLDRSDGAAQRPMAPWRRSSAPDRKPRAMWASHGEESGGANDPL